MRSKIPQQAAEFQLLPMPRGAISNLAAVPLESGSLQPGHVKVAFPPDPSTVPHEEAVSTECQHGICDH